MFVNFKQWRAVAALLLAAFIFSLFSLNTTPAKAQTDDENPLPFIAALDLNIQRDSFTNQPIMAWSADGRLLAVAVRGGGVQVWDAGRGELLANLPGSNMSALAFSPDDSLLVGAAQSVLILRVPVLLALGEITDETLEAAIFEQDLIYYATDPAALDIRNIMRVAISPDNQSLALAHGMGELSLWDISTPFDPLMLRAGSLPDPQVLPLPPMLNPWPTGLNSSANGINILTHDTDDKNSLFVVETLDADNNLVSDSLRAFEFPRTDDGTRIVPELSADASLLAYVDAQALHLIQTDRSNARTIELGFEYMPSVRLSSSTDGGMIGGAFLTQDGYQIVIFDSLSAVIRHQWPSIIPFYLLISPDGSRLALASHLGIELYALTDEAAQTPAPLSFEPTSSSSGLSGLTPSAPKTDENSSTSDAIPPALSSHTLEFGRHNLSFDYPANWFIADQSRYRVAISPQRALLDRLEQSDPGTFASGEVLGMIAIADRRDYGFTNNLDNFLSALEYVQAAEAALGEFVGEVTQPAQTISLGAWEGAEVRLSGANFDLWFIMLDINVRTDFAYFAHIFLVTAPGEALDYAALVEQIGTSFSYFEE